MAIERFFEMQYGLLKETTPFRLVINPVIIRLMDKQDWPLFILGFLCAFIISRAMFPFVLLILLRLDTSKMTILDWFFCFLFFAGSSLYLVINYG